jgi:DNA-directed RNA polymerase alpha subunit
VVETNSTDIIAGQLKKSVTVLDLTDYQKSALQSIEINTVGEILSSTEQVFQKAPYIGPKRSRKIMNVATAAVLEYLSG